MSSPPITFIAGIGGALAVLLGACTSTRNDASGPPPASVVVPLGAVALGLKTSQGVTVNAATYTISGNGITPMTGTIPLTDPSATASTVVGGIPAAMGYLFTLDANGDDGKTTCHGSATADVIGNATTGVTIVVQCRKPSELGGVTIGATFNNCPAITATTASPLAVSVGGTINLSATASDLDGNPLTLQWSAPSGQLGNTASAATTFTCTDEGPVIITVAVSDGMCQDQTTVSVTCLPFCAFRPDGTACDDHDACTRADHCAAGQCVGSDVVVCTASDQCHVAGICDPKTALCSNPTAAEGAMCMLPNASAACTAGACGVVSCASGFGNCDGNNPNGCEVSLLTSVDNCGVCGLRCATGTTCNMGLCLSPPPTGVTAHAGGWTVALSWQPAVAATGYRVFRATSADGPFAAIGTTTSATSFTDQAIATGAQYFYGVATISVGGTSALSTIAPVTPLTKQLCITASQGHAVWIYDATQTGRATPVRTITGSSTGFGFPKGIASSPVNGELFVSLQGGLIEVFSMAASGNVARSWTLSGALGGSNVYAVDVDPIAGEVVSAEYDAGGTISVQASDTGALKRTIAGATTKLGHVSSLVIDHVHGELFAGQQDPTGAFQQIVTFDLTANGDVAPKRVLGSSASAAAASWTVAYDALADELFSACNCNNQIAVYDRSASDGAPPKPTMQVTGLTTVYGLLLDTASDTIWAVGNAGFSTVMIVEVPRGGSGAVAPLRTGISLSTIGRLARCN